MEKASSSRAHCGNQVYGLIITAMLKPDANHPTDTVAGLAVAGTGSIEPEQASKTHPAPPSLPSLCGGSNIFDGLVSGSLLLCFCLLSWRQGSDAFGGYAFFRYSTTSGTLLALVTVFAAAVTAAGIYLLLKRLRHGRYCKIHFPQPKKKKRPGVLTEMKDALDELLGLKAGEEMPQATGPDKKRLLKNWFSQEKTRMGLSTLILVLLMYATPKFVLVGMGTHVLLYYLLEFLAFMATLNLWIIAWVELGE